MGTPLGDSNRQLPGLLYTPSRVRRPARWADPRCPAKVWWSDHSQGHEKWRRGDRAGGLDSGGGGNVTPGLWPESSDRWRIIHRKGGACRRSQGGGGGFPKTGMLSQNGEGCRAITRSSTRCPRDRAPVHCCQHCPVSVLPWLLPAHLGRQDTEKCWGKQRQGNKTGKGEARDT